MVKPAQRNTQLYQDKTDPRVTYLRLKALLRNNAINPSATMTVNVRKDMAATAMIQRRELDMRTNLNAWEAWRTLYYHFYGSLQTVVKRGS